MTDPRMIDPRMNGMTDQEKRVSAGDLRERFDPRDRYVGSEKDFNVRDFSNP
jgi:hypothetical protein